MSFYFQSILMAELKYSIIMGLFLLLVMMSKLITKIPLKKVSLLFSMILNQGLTLRAKEKCRLTFFKIKSVMYPPPPSKYDQTDNRRIYV